jgi:hypothetical protein
MMVEMHHDVDHVTYNGLTCTTLDAHECVLVEDACGKGVCYFGGGARTVSSVWGLPCHVFQERHG